MTIIFFIEVLSVENEVLEWSWLLFAVNAACGSAVIGRRQTPDRSNAGIGFE
ncbi:hypothetical protein AB0F85_05070 [Nocardia fluminea]|uniref:hypothetical protein n=1 Tax=Nocardia fluminea TaxID=134984 RepID=UPI0033E151CB